MTLVAVYLNDYLVCRCLVTIADSFQACERVKGLYAHLMYAGLLTVESESVQ
jgi:hypothetical protein